MKGYVLVHNFKVGKGYGRFFRGGMQILGVLEMDDGSCTCHAYLLFCPFMCFLCNTNQNSACALDEGYGLNEEERTYTNLAEQTTRTTFLLWGQDTKNKKDWDILRKAAGQKVAKKQRK